MLGDRFIMMDVVVVVFESESASVDSVSFDTAPCGVCAAVSLRDSALDGAERRDFRGDASCRAERLGGCLLYTSPSPRDRG